MVTATTAADTSDQSSALTVAAVDPPSTPDQPYLISQASTEINIGWTAPSSDGYSNLQGYRLYWNGGGGQPLITDAPVHDTNDEAVLSHVFSSLTPGERYVFALSAYNQVFESTRSD